MQPIFHRGILTIMALSLSLSMEGLPCGESRRGYERGMRQRAERSADVAAVRAAAGQQCDCAGAANHGEYVRCVAGVANEAVAQGMLQPTCRGGIVRCAARSTCGRDGFVTCCRTSASGRHGAVRSEAAPAALAGRQRVREQPGELLRRLRRRGLRERGGRERKQSAGV